MTEVEWAVFCDRAFVDVRSGFCVHGLRRRFTVIRLPITVPARLVVGLSADIEDRVVVAVDIHRPDGSSHTVRREVLEGRTAADFGSLDLPLTFSMVGEHVYAVRVESSVVHVRLLVVLAGVH